MKYSIIPLFDLLFQDSEALRSDFIFFFQMHKKVLDKGKPDDVMPGFKNKKVWFFQGMIC